MKCANEPSAGHAGFYSILFVVPKQNAGLLSKHALPSFLVTCSLAEWDFEVSMVYVGLWTDTPIPPTKEEVRYPQ